VDDQTVGRKPTGHKVVLIFAELGVAALFATFAALSLTGLVVAAKLLASVVVTL